MAVTALNRHDLYVKSGLINHKLNPSIFNVESVSDSFPAIDLLEYDKDIAEGIIFSGKVDGNNVAIYKSGAKRIYQTKFASITSKIPFIDDETIYTYWLPELYFVLYTENQYINICWRNSSKPLLSNLFSNSIMNMETETLVTNLLGRNAHIHQACIGGALSGLPSEAMGTRNFAKAIEYLQEASNTLLSSPGNTDLNFVYSWQKEIVRALGDTKRYSYHFLFAALTYLHKDIETLEQYEEFNRQYTTSDIKKMIIDLYKQNI